MYHIAGKIGGTKFWRMSKKDCFGEYNFGVSALASPRITFSIHFGVPEFGEQSFFRQIRQFLLPPIFSAIQYVICNMHVYGLYACTCMYDL